MSRAPVEANGWAGFDRATTRLCAGRVQSVQIAPAPATAAPTPNAHGIPNPSATSPSAIGPSPNPRSMTALAVPEATPRCVGDAVAKIAEKNAGVLNATPIARTAAPMMSPTGDRRVAATIRPTLIVTRAAVPRTREGTLSGTRANAMRQTTTTAP